MASKSDHLWIDRTHLGREFPDVHTWMDAFYRVYGGKHRRERHHREGIEEIRALWGDEAAKSAELHVILDTGHIPTRDDWTTFPRTIDIMGRRMDYLQRFGAHAEDCAFTMAFATVLPCKDCGSDTEQRLFDVPNGRFYCRRCGGVNHDPDFRLDSQLK